MKQLFLLLASLFMFVGEASNAEARTFWTNANSADSNQHCFNSVTEPSTTNQSRTILQGIGCLATGDTLKIKTGTYDERIYNDPTGPFSSVQAIPSGQPGAPTILMAADGPRTVLMRPSAINNRSVLGWPNLPGPFQYIAFDGLVFDGTNVVGNESGSAVQVIYIPGGASYLRFTNVEVRNGGMANLNAPGTTTNGITSGGNNLEFLNCQVHHNGLGPSSGTGSQGTRGYAWYFPGGSDLLIDNCDVHDQGGFGVHSYSGTPNAPMRVIVRNSRFWGNGVVTAQFQLTAAIRAINSTVYNNLIYNNGSLGIDVAPGSTTSIIYNNTVYGNGASGLGSGAGTIQNTIVRNNILYNNGPNGSSDIGVSSFSGSTLLNNLCGQTSPTTPPGACVVVGDPK
jgi:hypothetical protein